MLILAFVADLMFRSKIDVVARAAGARVLYPPAEADLPTLVTAELPRLAIVDLGLRGADPLAIISAVRAAGVARVIAFGSHVDAQTLAAARQAGAEEAVPRSAFSRDLGILLTELGP